MPKKTQGEKPITTNRKASHDYHILERFEAGIELLGTEVKSLRAGKANLTSAFARAEKGEVFLHGCDIATYDKASGAQHEPKRPRKLLLHREEIRKLQEATQIAGHTLPALRLYWKNGRAKAEIGIGKGKLARDKRDSLKEKAIKRETDREQARDSRG